MDGPRAGDSCLLSHLTVHPEEGHGAGVMLQVPWLAFDLKPGSFSLLVARHHPPPPTCIVQVAALGLIRVLYVCALFLPHNLLGSGQRARPSYIAVRLAPSTIVSKGQ